MGSIVVTLLFTSFLFTFPSLSIGDLHSWFCGPAQQCQLCPPCEPNLVVSPTCACADNINNCNCNCATHNDLHRYQLLSHSNMFFNHNVTHLALLDGNRARQRLLVKLVAFTCLNALLLFCVIVLLFFAPHLRHRCLAWRSRSLLRRRQRLMDKHQLVPLPSIALVAPPSVPPATAPPPPSNSPSSDELHRDLQLQQHVVTRVSRARHPTGPVSAPSPSTPTLAPPTSFLPPV